jgi:heme a synthase
VASAYIRLSDAGLGCPDWPGCYGRVTPGHVSADASLTDAQRPFPAPKPWKNIMHRYLAAILGLLILVVAVMAWLRRGQDHGSPAAALGLFGLVMVLALVGVWTVAVGVTPIIVTGHLLGGMTAVALLTWLGLGQLPISRLPRSDLPYAVRRWAMIALAVVAVQIALGGWMSANYAALACTDFPTCQGQWLPTMDFRLGFRSGGMTDPGHPLPATALTAMHWTHRVGALATCIVVGWLGVVLLKDVRFRAHAGLLMAALLVQLGLGVANVLLSLPLSIAVAHNAGAAALLIVLLVLNYRLQAVRGS